MKHTVIDLKLLKKIINKINFQKKLLEKGLENKDISWKEKQAWKIELKSINEIIDTIKDSDFPEIDYKPTP